MRGKANQSKIILRNRFVQNAELSGRVEDVMSDIEMFVKKVIALIRL